MLYIGFVALATMMWYGHAMSSVRDAHIPVHVTYVGKPNEMDFTPALPTTLDVEVRDAGSRLRVYFVTPLELTIDLSDQIRGRKGEIYVSEETIRRSLTNMIQGTTKLQNLTPAQIHSKYVRQESKVVQLMSNVTLVPAAEYQIMSDATLAPSTMQIFGYSDVIAKIDTLWTDSITLRDVRDTIRSKVHITAPKGIRLQTDSVSVTAVAERFTEKTLIRPIEVIDLPEGLNLHLFPQEATVTICCPMSLFSDIRDEDIHVECHFPVGNEEQLPLYGRCDNPYVTDIRINPATIEFIIEQ